MTAIRVLVTDDSVMFRKVLSDIIKNEPGLELAGTACDGLDCVKKVAILKPDIITLDIEMPKLNGLDAIPRILAVAPKLPIVMFSSLTEAGATATLEAMSRGAADYVAKPSTIAGTRDGMTAIREELIPKLKALASKGPARPALPPPGSMIRASRQRLPESKTPPGRASSGVKSPGSPTAGGPSTMSRRVKRQANTKPQVVAIGSSTGGPNALSEVLTKIPASFPLPIVITQHMPAVFTRLLAERLDATCKVSVREAEEGAVLTAGSVLIAPGDHHMTLARSGTQIIVKLDQGPKENYCRPAVDPLFRSTSAVFNGNVLSVVLTGMGQDGTKGAEVIHAAGGTIIIQDKKSSVVWGMPGSISDAGLADEVLPITEIADAIQRLVLLPSFAKSPRTTA